MSKFSFNDMEAEVTVSQDRSTDTVTLSRREESNGIYVIRKYENRKLYDAKHHRYITGVGIRDMVKQGIEFVVLEHKTGADVTSEVLGNMLAALLPLRSTGEANPNLNQLLRSVFLYV